MIEASTSRRAVILLASVALIAGCKVIPKGAENIPPPEPVPSDALPKDQARHRVALLVPLTGPNAGMGQSVANATTMALLDTDAKNIRITTYDTAQGAAVAANQAMKDGNKLILGPLATSDVAPVAAVARAAKVPLITYGNDGAVAARDVFVLGSRMENSVERVVSFAASKGITRFAVLAPKGDYGSRVSASYANAVKAAGGSIVASDSYDRGNSSALSAAAFFGGRELARRRAVGAHPHSRPGQHGAYALIWVAAPALLVLILLSVFAAPMERQLTAAGTPDVVAELEHFRRDAFFAVLGGNDLVTILG